MNEVCTPSACSTPLPSEIFSKERTHETFPQRVVSERKSTENYFFAAVAVYRIVHTTVYKLRSATRVLTVPQIIFRHFFSLAHYIPFPVFLYFHSTRVFSTLSLPFHSPVVLDYFQTLHPLYICAFFLILSFDQSHYTSSIEFPFSRFSSCSVNPTFPSGHHCPLAARQSYKAIVVDVFVQHSCCPAQPHLIRPVTSGPPQLLRSLA